MRLASACVSTVAAWSDSSGVGAVTTASIKLYCGNALANSASFFLHDKSGEISVLMSVLSLKWLMEKTIEAPVSSTETSNTIQAR